MEGKGLLVVSVERREVLAMKEREAKVEVHRARR